MIATHAHCGSSDCPHKVPHKENEFCHDGMCRWSSECRCIPESKREMLEEYLMGLFPDERIEGIANAIESIFKEADNA